MVTITASVTAAGALIIAIVAGVIELLALWTPWIQVHL